MLPQATTEQGITSRQLHDDFIIRIITISDHLLLNPAGSAGVRKSEHAFNIVYLYSVLDKFGNLQYCK